jgi:hypothetical protein
MSTPDPLGLEGAPVRERSHELYLAGVAPLEICKMLKLPPWKVGEQLLQLYEESLLKGLLAHLRRLSDTTSGST